MPKLVWIDLETTGLSPQEDFILEAALAESDFSDPFNLTFIYQNVFQFTLNEMAARNIDSVVLEMHRKNGLWEECRASKVHIQDLEGFMANRYAPPSEPSEDYEPPILAGSLPAFDRAFLDDVTPYATMGFSHRLYDVTAVKLFCRSLGMPKLPKGEGHRATADVIESMQHAAQCAAWFKLRNTLTLS